MPVTVAVSADGQTVHNMAPLVWREKIARMQAETELEPAE
jgi:fumarate hydratase class I